MFFCLVAPQVPKAHKALRLGSRLRLITSTPQCASRHLKHSMQPTMAWIWEGPMQRGTITRDLKLDRREKYEEDKVFYSWFDAPIGYLSITSCYTSEWDKWWKNPENVELYQFIGKESVPFHTVMFPSAQLGTGESWTMMKTISVTEYLKYEGGEFSKSKGVGVFGDDVKDTSIPVEVWRYYLLTKRPEVSDTSFGWKDLQAKLNNELRSNLGKFVNRVLSFIAKPECAGYYGCVIPVAPHAESHIRTKLLGEKVGGLVEEYVKAMEKVKLRQGLHIAMRISAEGNRYLRDNNFLRLYKEDKPSCGVVMRSAAGLVHLLAQLLEPFMPSFSREVFKQLNLPPHFSLGETLEASRLWEILPHNHRIGTPQPLFMELKDEQVQRYKEKFAGTLVADRGARDAESTRLDPRRFRPVEAASQARRRRRGSLF